MTENAKNSLKLARAALVKNNTEEAATHYRNVLQLCPNDPEAMWFAAFESVVKMADADLYKYRQEIAKNYRILADGFYPLLSYIAAMEESEEKHTLALKVLKDFPPLYGTLHLSFTMLQIHNDSAITIEDVVQFSMELGHDTMDDAAQDALAEKILELFGDGKPYCLWAADIWKERIAKRFRYSAYRNFQDRGKELWFDKLAKQIQKYDPSYELPQFKTAGCVTTNEEAGKVNPGQ